MINTQRNTEKMELVLSNFFFSLCVLRFLYTCASFIRFRIVSSSTKQRRDDGWGPEQRKAFYVLEAYCTHPEYEKQTCDNGGTAKGRPSYGSAFTFFEEHFSKSAFRREVSRHTLWLTIQNT